MEKNNKKNKKNAIKTPTRAFSGENVNVYVERENVKVIDSETSDILTELKHREIANKKVKISSEMKDAMTQEEETIIDVERFFDVKNYISSFLKRN